MLQALCCRGDAPVGHGRGTVCPRCGHRSAAADLPDPMLQVLHQLAQFGLDAEGRPLLESRDEES